MRRDACKWKVNYPARGMETLALLAPNYANSAGALESKFSCYGVTDAIENLLFPGY
jgi:hypothetical protein